MQEMPSNLAVIEMNPRGIWLHRQGGRRMDFRGQSLDDVVSFCKWNFLKLVAIQAIPPRRGF
jgi:hypothetical protein